MVETGHKFHDNVAKQVAWAHWFTFFNIIAISLISLRYIAYSGLADTGLGIAYQFISLIGHFSFLAAVVFGFLLFPMAFIIRHNLTYRLISIAIATIAITFLIVDTQIYRLYEFHLNPLIWQFLQRPEQVEAIYSINLHYISIPIIFTLEVCFSFFLWKKVRKIQAKRVGKPIAFFLVSCFIASHLIFIWADATQYRPVTLEKSIYPLSYPMTARTFLSKRGLIDKQKLQKKELQPDGVDPTRLDYPRKPLSFGSENEAKQNNILLINIESLRADMLNAHNMPNLFKLSNNNINFKQHFSGSNEREQGIFSFFYGLPNIYWDNVRNNHISPVLINQINQQQRPMGLFSSIGLLHPEFLQSTFSQLQNNTNVLYSTSQNNTQTVQQWQKWISNQSLATPWFAYVYLEQPNKLPLAQGVYKTIPEQSKQLSVYQDNVKIIDSQIAAILKQLHARNQYQNSIILITGTSGLSFKGNNSPEQLINGAHVPLVIVWPKKPALQVNKLTSHLDIAPTLMKHIFSVESDSSVYSSGQDLLSDNGQQYVLSGDEDNYILYQTDKITLLSRSGDIKAIDWQGNKVKQTSQDIDITLLIDVLYKLRRFTAN